jgi:hypothetical protein
MLCWHIDGKNYLLYGGNTQKPLHLKGETWLLGINCDKDCFLSKLQLSQQAYDMIEKK